MFHQNCSPCKRRVHLTKKGIKQIRLLKSQMNQKLLGSRSAGNPLATWEREMFQKSHSPVKSGKLGVPKGSLLWG